MRTPIAVRDPGVVLDNSPELTVLRLPSRAGWPARISFGMMAAIVLTITFLLSPAFGGDPAVAAVAACVGSAALAGIYLVSRWSLRRGVIVSLTPDKFVVRKHWSDGGEALEFFLDQVRFEETRREIVVSRGRKAFRFGSGLTPEDRRSVVAFLNDEIAIHLRPAPGTVRPAPQALDANPPGHTFAMPVLPEDLDLGALAVRGDLDPGPEPPPAPEDLDPLTLALCGQFRGADARKAHLAPAIPQPVLAAALQSYLDLRDDEVLLAIVGADAKGRGAPGCALTTRRIYWPGKATGATGNGPARCRSVDYAALPGVIGVTAFGTAIDLGEGRKISLVGDKALVAVMERYLGGVRALFRGELTARGIPDADRARARGAWPRVTAAGSEARAFQAEIRSFQDRTFVVSRARVTPALVAACVLVYAAMVARGVPAFRPSAGSVLAWGADFGPSVVFDHQYWRVFTSIFLHFGLFHLAMNMLCLATSGPVVERFFGHLGFAALYTLSGLGGSIASLWFHPTIISAGASGAIFGVFGGMLGFLAVRRREVPVALLKPMRSGALAFVVYNTLFGLSMPGIDTAAHLGGLASGFVCGLLLTAVAPARPGDRAVASGFVRRAGVLAVLAAALAGLGWQGLDAARARILADPVMGAAIRNQMDAAPAWNAFFERARPVFTEFDRIGAAIDRVLAGFKEDTAADPKTDATLNGLEADSRALGARVAGLPAANPEIEALRSHMAAAQVHQSRIIKAVRQASGIGDASHVTGPDAFIASVQAYKKEFESIKSLSDVYVRAHHLELHQKTP